MKSQRFFSFKFKIFLIYLLIIITPLTIISIIISSQYTSLIKDRFEVYARQLSQQSVEYFDSSYYNLSRLVVSPYYQVTFQKELVKIFDNPIDYNKVHTNTFITDRLNEMVTTNPGINSITLFDKEGNIVTWNTPKHGYTFNYALKSESFFQQLSLINETLFIPTHLQEITNEKDRYVTSIVRGFRNNETGKLIGFMNIDIKLEYLSDLLGYASSNQQNEIKIIDDEGRFIFNNKTMNFSSPLSYFNYLDGQQGSFKYRVGNDDLLVTYSKSKITNWYFIVETPMTEINKKIHNILYFNIFLLLSVILVALLVSLVAATGLTAPINKLLYTVHEVRLGDFSKRFYRRKNDEFRELGVAFNAMLDEIQRLIQKEYIAKIKEKDAELYALQSQINPHFLYNTLESISMKAELNNDIEVSDMINVLGKLFRMSLEKSGRLVSIEQELNHVRFYMKLLMMRYPGKFHVQYDIDDTLLEIFIPKFILQPLVENSVSHGLGKSSQGRITIGLKSNSDYVIITVDDDGVGISYDEMNRLNQQFIEDFDSRLPNSSHIGLKNVNTRIKLLFGSNFGLKILSKVEQGSRIQVILPNRRKNQEENHV